MSEIVATGGGWFGVIERDKRRCVEGKLDAMTEPMPENDRSQWERMLAGELYVADDPQIEAAKRRARRFE